MKRSRPADSSLRRPAWAAVLLLAATVAATAFPADLRDRVSFDAGWRFQKGDPAGVGTSLDYASLKPALLADSADPDFVVRAGADNPGADVAYAQAGFDDTSWRSVDLPHDWAIEGPFDLKLNGATGRLAYAGPVWYRKTFATPAGAAGRRVLLDVDGAMSYASVWLNGHFLGGWPHGYTSFQVDLTGSLEPSGRNVIAIRLDTPDNASRWYPGGGLYRNVWLETVNPVRVAHWGAFVTTPVVSPAAATVKLQVNVTNEDGAPAAATVRTQIFALDAAGNPSGAPVGSAASGELALPARGDASATLALEVSRPKLWDLEHRNRYAAVTTVRQGGRDVDSNRVDFGIRTIAFDPDRGFLLNGRRVQLQGVCDHSDLGALGTAVNVRGLERQLQLLQEMGCNALRTSHNAPAPELLELCDRLGILVMDESFDTWENSKNRTAGYNLLFADWRKKDLQSEVRRDRNHPSIILYSAGNEVNQQGTARGNEILKELIGFIHAEDPTRMVTTANNSRGFSEQSPADYVFGYNYQTDAYARYRRENPRMAVIGSETVSTVSSRGIYTFPVAAAPGEKTGNRAPDPHAGWDAAAFQMSSYDLYYPAWGASPDTEFAALDGDPGIAGEFVWTGFDYLGEPTPYGGRADPARSSYFGIIDLAGFKKDRFYLYQSHWRPELPMAHILPHWNWPGRVGQVTPVHVYTSGDEAELFLNGRSLGRRRKGPGEYRLRWDDVVYEPGVLKVVAYRNGVHWAEDTVRTTGPEAKLGLTADRTRLAADGSDLCYVTVAVQDKAGLTVPTAGRRIRFEVTGPAKLVATDNGDPTDLESFSSKDRKTFNGLALAILRIDAGRGGRITVRATADGLTGADVALRSAPPSR